MSDTNHQSCLLSAGGRSVHSLDTKLHLVQALRFIAAFAVVCLHSSFYTFERLDQRLGIYALGANGVRLFFVISGFVMVISTTKLPRTLSGAGTFALRRIIRIVPLYWLINLAKLGIMLVTPVVVLHAQFDWQYIAKSFVFIPALNVDGRIEPLLGVGWTLNFEMFFYALFALVITVRVGVAKLIAPTLLALTLLSQIKTLEWPIILQFWANPIVLDFLAGIILARWLQSERPHISAVITALVGAVALVYLFIPMLPFTRPRYDSLAGSLTTTLAAAATVWSAVMLEPHLGRRTPGWLLLGGTASYSLYLIHPLVAPIAPQILARFGFHYPGLAILCSVAIALMVSFVVYRWIEAPLTSLITRTLRELGWP